MPRRPHVPRDAAPAPSKPGRPASVGPPHPHPLPQGARGPERPRGCARLPIRRGRGDEAPTGRKSEGGWVGPSGAQRPLLRDGVWGRTPTGSCAPALEGSVPVGSMACPSPPPFPQGEGAGGALRQRSPVSQSGRGRGGKAPTEKENPRAGGWAERRVAPAPPGWGCGGRSPPQVAARQPSGCGRAAERTGAWRRSPHKKDAIALDATPRLPSRRGRGGEAPTEKEKSEGGWVG